MQPEWPMLSWGICRPTMSQGWVGQAAVQFRMQTVPEEGQRAQSDSNSHPHPQAPVSSAPVPPPRATPMGSLEVLHGLPVGEEGPRPGHKWVSQIAAALRLTQGWPRKTVVRGSPSSGWSSTWRGGRRGLGEDIHGLLGNGRWFT